METVGRFPTGAEIGLLGIPESVPVWLKSSEFKDPMDSLLLSKIYNLREELS